MNNTKSTIVLSVLLTLGGIGIMSIMTDEAFATSNADVTTTITNCNSSDTYRTMLMQSAEGNTVTATIDVPSSVCDNSFTSATITTTDATNNTCAITITSGSSGDNYSASCPSSFDVSDTALAISAVVNYGSSYSVKYTQQYS